MSDIAALIRIGINRSEGKVYIYWTTPHTQVIVVAFAKAHKVNLTVHDGKQCLGLRFPEQRDLIQKFLFESCGSDSLARQAYTDICDRIAGRVSEERTYGLN